MLLSIVLVCGPPSCGMPSALDTVVIYIHSQAVGETYFMLRHHLNVTY
jgi:hypothetical protein